MGVKEDIGEGRSCRRFKDVSKTVSST